MIAQRANFLRLRWLAVLLLSLLGVTIGSAASSAERGDFGCSSYAANNVATLDAAAKRFSQSNVRSSLPEITASVKANGWQGAPIDVVRMAEGTLTAVDNTRLAAAALSNTPFQATIRGFGEAFPPARAGGNLQGGTWGEALMNRIGGQKPGWQRLYPNGSPFTGVHPSTPRQDNDDVACWSNGAGEKVFVIHDFASAGWESEAEFSDVWAWFRSAIDETIAWD